MPLKTVGEDIGTIRGPVARTSHSISHPLLLVAVLMPAILAFGILFHQRLPVPYQDDYHAILVFALQYERSPTAGAKLLEIAAEQHNEYKLIFEHAIIASEMQLTHHLSFAFLTGAGDLLLLPTGFLLWRVHRSDEVNINQRLFQFLPISLIYFSLSY